MRPSWRTACIGLTLATGLLAAIVGVRCLRFVLAGDIDDPDHAFSYVALGVGSLIVLAALALPLGRRGARAGGLALGAAVLAVGTAWGLEGLGVTLDPISMHAPVAAVGPALIGATVATAFTGWRAVRPPHP